MALLAVLIATVLSPLAPRGPEASVDSSYHGGVVTTRVQPVAWNPYDDISGGLAECVTVAGEVFVGLQAKGLKIAVSRAKFKSFFASWASLIPGVACGAGLGRKNVDVICWLSRRPKWVPGSQIVRNFVYSASGGASATC